MWFESGFNSKGNSASWCWSRFYDQLMLFMFLSNSHKVRNKFLGTFTGSYALFTTPPLVPGSSTTLPLCDMCLWDNLYSNFKIGVNEHLRAWLCGHIFPWQFLLFNAGVICSNSSPLFWFLWELCKLGSHWHWPIEGGDNCKKDMDFCFCTISFFEWNLFAIILVYGHNCFDKSHVIDYLDSVKILTIRPFNVNCIYIWKAWQI